MVLFHHHNLEKQNSLMLFTFVLCCLCFVISGDSSIYEVLKSHGLPMGLLPKGVRNFTLDNSGKFVVHLDQPCNSKFEKKENELHYERNVSGTLSYGQIDLISGISAKDLFLWFEVKKIYVSSSSSGVIYFDVGVVSKQFSLSSFDSPKDCTTVSMVVRTTDLEDVDEEDDRHVVEVVVSKNLSRKIRYKLDQGI
ncbi:putative protein isoform X1 [Capsicum annuum]|uniref:uncharacterized protein LOC107873569 isoform X1 n=1 Tax=Capsicum annuum TaxID=4072 RepID=UPI0007BEDA6D|nr:uncharacterized protein LOC107873569 isoform X1 [Capsicum annuum]